jgi:hypothetical protein
MKASITIAAIILLLSGAVWYGMRAKQHEAAAAREKTILSHLRQSQRSPSVLFRR